MNEPLRQYARDKYASGASLDEIARLYKVRRRTVATWLGIDLPKAKTMRIPVVPDAKVRVYRVLTQPKIKPRKVGGWTAKGEVLLRTQNSKAAYLLCAQNKNSVVVQNHGIVLRYNGVPGIHNTGTWVRKEDDV